MENGDSTEAGKLPRGPRSALLNTMRLGLNPYAFYFAAARKYGEPFSIPSLNGTVMTSGAPDFLKAVFTADPGVLQSFLTLDLGPIVGDESVAVMNGPRHLRERKLLAPPFHGERMQVYGRLIQDISRRHADRFRPGEKFKFQETSLSISLEVIIQAVFGVSGEARVAEFITAIQAFVRALHPGILLTKVLRRRFGGIGPWSRFVRARDQLDALLYAQIASRRAAPEGHADILSLMLAARHDDGTTMTDQSVRDELVTLLFAGQETTAVTLAWAFHLIHRNPEVEERLRAEIASAGDSPTAIAQLPYLEATCKEALRLHPTVPEAMRRAVKPFQYEGWTVPAGGGVCACITLTHARENLYPEPARFRPERFLERQFSPFEFVPFGGGGRRCLGAAFAMFELKLVVATLLSRGRLKLTSDAPAVPARRNITIAPRGGVEMVLINTP